MLFCLLADQSSNKIKIEYEKDGKSSIDKNVGISNGKYYKYFELYYRDIIDIIEEKIKIDPKSLSEDQLGYAYLKFLNILNLG